MALNQATLSANIVANLTKPLNVVNAQELKAVADGIAKAVIDHLTQSGLVTVTGTATTSQGPAPVVGTGTIS